MRLIRSRAGSKVGQLAQMNVEFYGASFDGGLLNLLTPACIGHPIQQAQRHFWVGVRDDDSRLDTLTAFEDDSLAGQNLRHWNAGDDRGPGLASRVAKVERHHAHSALHVTPHAGHAAEPPRRVMKANRSRALVERTRICADDSLTEIGHLQPFVFEISFDQLGHRPVEEQLPSLIVVAQAVFDLIARGRVSDPKIASRKTINTPRFLAALKAWPQRVAQSADHVAHRLEAGDIASAQATDFFKTTLIVIPELNALSVEERYEQAVDRRGPVEAAARQFQFLDDERMQQAR